MARELMEGNDAKDRHDTDTGVFLSVESYFVGCGEETYNQPTDRMPTSTIFWRRMSCRRHMARTGSIAIIRSVAVFKVPCA
jgi:hypothetical protein